MITIRCPKCDGNMRVFDGRERTVRGGIWYVMACPRCHYVFDLFRPRRSKPTGQQQTTT